jgi:hypothetical protein
MSSSGSVVVGYKYFLGLHLIFALSGIVAVRKIRSGDKTLLWEGNATSNQTLTIDKPGIFGGNGVGGRGGFVADVDLMFGGASQTANSFLQNVLQPGRFMPAYRKRFGMVFRSGTRGAYIGNTGSVDPIAILATGSDDTADGDWQPSLRWVQASDVDFPDINPAHIFRDLLISSDIGLGLNSADIDDDNFAAAAQAFYTEGFGVSMLFTSGGTAQGHIQEVSRHTNTICYQDHASGLFKLKLMRDDYGLSDLLTFDEDNSVKLSFSRTGIGEQINRINIVYHDVLLGRNDTVTLDDLALNDLHGGSPISKEIQYTGISSRALANRVAGRDLKQLSAPLAKVSLDINRQGSSLRPGDVFIWNNAELGISGMLLRIIKLSYGTPTNPTIKVECVEDVFSYGTTRFVGTNPYAWETQASDPEPITGYKITEVPYYLYYAELGGIPYGYDATQGEVLVLAEKETTTDQSLDILHRPNTVDPYKTQNDCLFSPHSTLVSDITEAQTSVTLEDDGQADLDQVNVGDAAYIGDEIVRVDSIAESSGGWDLTIGRGCADTVAETHAAGTKVYFISRYHGVVGNDYDDGDTIRLKLLPLNARGRLDEGDASVLTFTLDQRANKPYAPGKLRIEGDGTGGTIYPPAFMGDFAISCAHRDRLSQTGDLVSEDEASIGPEASTTYILRQYDENGVLRNTVSGSAFTSNTWSTEEADCGLGRLNNSITVRLKATRGGVESHQEHDFTTDRADYGYSYGEYYGGY